MTTSSTYDTVKWCVTKYESGTVIVGPEHLDASLSYFDICLRVEDMTEDEHECIKMQLAEELAGFLNDKCVPEYVQLQAERNIEHKSVTWHESGGTLCVSCTDTVCGVLEAGTLYWWFLDQLNMAIGCKQISDDIDKRCLERMLDSAKVYNQNKSKG